MTGPANGFPTPEIGQWVETWMQTRQLTYDLLRALPYAVMNFSPHPDFGTLARQLRHSADIEACYVAALRTGTMDFAAQPRRRALEQSKENLEAYLRHIDDELLTTLRTLPAGHLARPISWGDRQATLLQHLLSLLQHETLHQGMWAFYAKIADLPLPESWQRPWRLG